jgi:putative phosphoesterase
MTINIAGLIGDVHAEDKYLEAAIDFLSTLDLDVLLCTGDVVDGPGDANRCAQLLMDTGVYCVKGNHDRWLLSGWMRESPEALAPTSMSSVLQDFLLSLPPSIDFETRRGRLMLCHGVGVNDMRSLTRDDYGYALTVNDELQDLIAGGISRLMIGGHTHRSMVKSFGGLTVINPGTLLRRHEPGFATVDFEENTVQFYTLDDNGSVTTGSQAALPA